MTRERSSWIMITENGSAVGIMALEEHFSKELLEANGRRESVIIRFDEAYFIRGKWLTGGSIEDECSGEKA